MSQPIPIGGHSNSVQGGGLATPIGYLDSEPTYNQQQQSQPQHHQQQAAPTMAAPQQHYAASSEGSSEGTRTGAIDAEKHSHGANAGQVQGGGNPEYDALIQYIQDSANKKRGAGDDAEEDKTVKKRSLLTFWKTRTVHVDKEGNEIAEGTKPTPEAWFVCISLFGIFPLSLADCSSFRSAGSTPTCNAASAKRRSRSDVLKSAGMSSSRAFSRPRLAR